MSRSDRLHESGMCEDQSIRLAAHVPSIRQSPCRFAIMRAIIASPLIAAAESAGVQTAFLRLVRQTMASPGISRLEKDQLLFRGFSPPAALPPDEGLGGARGVLRWERS